MKKKPARKHYHRHSGTWDCKACRQLKLKRYRREFFHSIDSFLDNIKGFRRDRLIKHVALTVRHELGSNAYAKLQLPCEQWLNALRTRALRRGIEINYIRVVGKHKTGHAHLHIILLTNKPIGTIWLTKEWKKVCANGDIFLKTYNSYTGLQHLVNYVVKNLDHEGSEAKRRVSRTFLDSTSKRQKETTNKATKANESICSVKRYCIPDFANSPPVGSKTHGQLIP